MPAYLIKNKDEILRQAITKLEKNTGITATAPGSIARTMIELITSELGDMYDLLDFNLSQHFLTTASGSALDMIGALYGVTRKSESNLITITKNSGAFYFYLTSPASVNLIIPSGTMIYTNISSYVGQVYSYVTTEDTIIPAGRLRAYASIKPAFTDSVFTAGTNTLNIHTYTPPSGITVLCKNTKPIQAQIGYEDDESYRFRITKAIRVGAAGTAEAVRFAGLAVPGVRDIKINQAPYGLGSFEVIVVPEDYNGVAEIVNKVTTAINAVRPLGVRVFIKRPMIKVVNVNVNLVIPAANVSGVADAARLRAKEAISRYVASLLPGEQFVYNRFVQLVLDSSEAVKDLVVVSFTVAGAEASRRNYQPESDHHLVPGNITVGIATA